MQFKYLTREILEIAAEELINDETEFTCGAISWGISYLQVKTTRATLVEWQDFLLEMNLRLDVSLCEDFPKFMTQEAREIRAMLLLFAAEAFCDS